MKAKVIIEDGEINLVLRPENKFEIDIIEKYHFISGKESDVVVKFIADRGQFGLSDHEINITIKDKESVKSTNSEIKCFHCTKSRACEYKRVEKFCNNNDDCEYKV